MGLFMLKSKEVHKLPRTVMDRIFHDMNDLYTAFSEETLHRVISELNKYDCSPECINDIQQLLSENALGKAATNLQTSAKQINYFTSEFNLLLPETYVLAEKENRTKDTLQYVKINKMLSILLKNDIFRAEINSQHVPNLEKNSILQDFCSGALYQNNAYFKENSHALQIILYFDQFEVANPLGPARGEYKIAAFYFTLGNLRPELRLKLSCIFLAMLVLDSHIKKYGLEAVVKPLVDDLNVLAADGIEIIINGNPVTYCGILSYIVADNLGSHEIGGYLQSFSGARICRHCNATKTQIQTVFNFEEYQRRTPEIYDYQAARVEEDPETNTIYGINQASPFNKCHGFHAATGLPPDVMHDLLEGVIPLTIKQILRYFVVERILPSLEKLNKLILNFPYGANDKANKPSALPKHLLKRKGDIKQTATKSWCLFRLLPLIIGNFIPAESPHWQLYLLLKEIVDCILSPNIPQGMLGYLNKIIVQFLVDFTMLFQISP